MVDRTKRNTTCTHAELRHSDVPSDPGAPICTMYIRASEEDVLLVVGIAIMQGTVCDLNLEQAKASSSYTTAAAGTRTSSHQR